MTTGAAADNKQKVLDYFGGNFQSFYAKHLPHLKKIAGDEWAAVCPFHDDRDPSLNVNAKTGLFYCHGCEAKGDIFTFAGRLLGLSNGDFPKILESIAGDFGIALTGSNGKKPDASKSARITAVYDYHTTDGEMFFQVVRKEPGSNGKKKDFLQRRPDGRGGHIWNLQGIEPVLYHLPEVMAADEVFLVEGEKDADALRALGFTATCNAGGAGKWRDSYTEALRGKDVVLLPDNDGPGKKHALHVAGELHGVARTVKLLVLPGLEEKGDASDFIAAFDDPAEAAERLAIMIEAAPEWGPEEEADPDEKPRFQFIHNAELLRDLRPISWRIDGILLDNSFYYNFGDSGTFKTFIELDRLLCVAAGIPYHGHRVKQGTVFYIAGEGQQGIGRRIAAWHIDHGTKAADVPFFVAKVPTQLMDIAAVDNVRAAVDALSKEYGPPAVLHCDTLARNFGDGDENATKDMNRVIANMDQAFGNDFCRGLTHHTGHANKDRARGSYALHAGADIAFRMEPVKGTDQIFVECKKMKDAPKAPPMIFEKKEIVLQIGDERDTTFVMDFVCEGDEATEMNQPAELGVGKIGRGKNQSIAMDELNRLYDEHRKNLSSGGFDPADARVTIEDWRNACGKKGMTRNAFYKVKTSLMANGQIKMDKVHVYTNTD